jgi:hypothetical protein
MYELIDGWNSMKLRQTEPTKSIQNTWNTENFRGETFDSISL